MKDFKPAFLVILLSLVVFMVGGDKFILTAQNSVFEFAAEQGLVSAQRTLADKIYFGSSGVKADPSQFLKWARMAADNGDGHAQTLLGYYYLNVVVDAKEAAKWGRLAAEQGYPRGQRFLAYLYFNGFGVEQDEALAVSWWLKAAQHGDAVAQYNLGHAYANGTGVEIDFKKADFWLEKSARQGYKSAANMRIVIAAFIRSGEIDPGTESHLPKGTGAETYVKRVEEKLARALASQAPVEPWLLSKTHMMLARGYGFLGNETKMLEHMKAIESIRDRRVLIRPYMDLLFTSLGKEDDNEALSIITGTGEAAAVMDKPAYVRDLFDPEFGTTVGSEIPADWLEKTFCSMAGYEWARQRKYGSLRSLQELPACKEQKAALTNYEIASLLKDAKYAEAYEAARPTFKRSLYALSLFKNCSSTDKPSQDLHYFLKMKEENPSAILHVITYLDADPMTAFDYTQAHPELLEDKQAYLPLLETYKKLFLADKEEETLKIAQQMKLFEEEVPLTGRISGFYRNEQWWNVGIDGGRVLEENPGPLAYKLAMLTRNDRARFKTLNDLYLSIQTDSIGAFPGCDGTGRACIIGELERIAKAEEKDYDKDLMYGLLSELARISGDKSENKRFLSKIKDMNRGVCFWDMCMGSGTVIKQESRVIEKKKAILMAKTKKTPNFLDDLMEQVSNRYYAQSFSTGKTAHPALATELKEMYEGLNKSETRFLSVSAQSGYAALNFQRAERGSCPLID